VLFISSYKLETPKALITILIFLESENIKDSAMDNQQETKIIVYYTLVGSSETTRLTPL